MLTPAQAIAHLKRKQITLDAKSACDSLNCWLNSIQLLSLYEFFFPWEWSTSNASVDPVGGMRHSDREMEFLQLVDAKLFPLPGVYMESYLSGYERCEEIVIQNHGLDWLCNEEWANMPDEWQCLAFFSNEGYGWDRGVEKIVLDGIAIAPIETIDFQKLSKVCRKVNLPIRYLPTVLDLFNYSTGNVWLDGSSDLEPEYVLWSKENVNFLANQWAQAQQTLSEFDTLVDWLSVDLSNRLFQIVKLWNSCSSEAKALIYQQAI